MRLYTIGYEGLEPEGIFQTLKSSGVEKLLDIRELPLSRKHGFSKNALAAEAVYWGIEYLHLRALGCPKDIRHAYRADQNWDLFTNRFHAYLETQLPAIEDASNLCLMQACCLLCVESDPHRCHRYYVAEAIQKASQKGLEIVHLEPISPARLAQPEN